jgi:PBSX family phage terminase large subunit
MNQAKIQITKQDIAILTEAKRRKAKLEEIRAGLFDKQLAFIDDPSPLKTAQCTRRAGKSYCDGAYLILSALENPGTSQLYIGLTKKQCERIMFKDIFKVLNRKHKLDIKFDHTDLELELPNGSVIYVLGMDSSPDEFDKVLGQKFKLVVVDEAASFRQDIKELVHTHLEPACADLEGTICLTSSPKANTNTYFFDITYYSRNNSQGQPEERYVEGWTRHKWGWRDNPFNKEAVEKMVMRKITQNPRVVETTGFRNMWRNEWVLDIGSRCYKYHPQRNVAVACPSDVEFAHTIGIDLGHSPDPTAFAIWAYSELHNYIYLIRTFKKEKMDITDVAEMIWSLKRRYNPIRITIDNASKQAVEELKNRHGLPELEAAEKSGKSDMIEIMNADFITGRIKVIAADCQDVINEWEYLTWDTRSQIRQEDPNKPNHCSDASLYSWRKVLHSSNVARKQERALTEEEKLEKWAKEEGKKLQRIAKKSSDFVKNDFGKLYGFH